MKREKKKTKKNQTSGITEVIQTVEIDILVCIPWWIFIPDGSVLKSWMFNNQS